MTPARWDQIVAVFESAIGCPPAERDALLARACGADEALRAEIDALLAADSDATGFDLPALPGASRVVDAVWQHVERTTWTSGADPLDERALGAQLQTALGAAYRVEREIVGGGMSRVFVADDVQLGRRVAVKVLPVTIHDPSTLARFRREVQLAASLRHPHIVPLLTAGESVDGLVYYTMPFIEDETLRQRLDREGVLALDVVVRILRELAGALTYAHQRGVVHCDIKPANILVDGDHVLVTDFGIARALSEVARGDASPEGARARPTAGVLTLGGRVLGTPAYISPEQATSGGIVDQRADVYSLGCVVYEMLTGTRPPPQRRADRPGDHSAPVMPVSARRPGLPAALDAVVAKALATTPDERWATAAAFAEHFTAVVTARDGAQPVT